MRKIKDNGRTLIKKRVKKRNGDYRFLWRETPPSKLSRIIKRMVRK